MLYLSYLKIPEHFHVLLSKLTVLCCSLAVQILTCLFCATHDHFTNSSVNIFPSFQELAHLPPSLSQWRATGWSWHFAAVTPKWRTGTRARKDWSLLSTCWQAGGGGRLSFLTLLVPICQPMTCLKLCCVLQLLYLQYFFVVYYNYMTFFYLL